MSLHIGAKKGAIAEHILLPGDPLRAKHVAETFLKDVTCYNEVRGMLGYTGYYNGKRISVQGTGMGLPSISIYVNELITEYDVKKLIRIGTAGSLQKEIQIRDLVAALSASTTSSINKNKFNQSDFAPCANFDLLLKAHQAAIQLNIPFKAGNVLSADEFYADADYHKKWMEYGVLCVEMEANALYSLAAKHKVQALSLLTISDSLVTGESTSAQERQNTFDAMVQVALTALCE